MMALVFARALLAAVCVFLLADLVPPAVADSVRPPASAFFRYPLLISPELSPNGKHVAGIIRTTNKDTLVVRPTSGGPLEALLEVERSKFDKTIKFRWFGWASNDCIVTAAHHQLYGVFLDGKKVLFNERWLSKEPVYVQSIPSFLPKDPDHFLVSLYFRNSKYPEVFRVDLREGTRTRVQSPMWGVWDWRVDKTGKIRAGRGDGYPRGKGDEVFRLFVARRSADEKFVEVARWRPIHEDGLGFAGFSQDPNTVYVVKPDGPGRRYAIYEYDLTRKKLGKLVFRHPEVDVGYVVTSRVDGRPLYVAYENERREVFFLDERQERLQSLIDQALPNRTNIIVSRDNAEDTFLIRSSSDVVPPEYYVLDGNDLSLLVKQYPDLDGVTLSPMKPVTYKARDGSTIHGYLTRPANAPAGPIATVVMPHGGPTSRNVWGWSPTVQFLASQGFAVFQPNFRGSDGYGEDFLQAGWGEWGLAMQDDITDGVRWLIDQKLADPKRIAIFGGSYGGYAALQGVVTTPELYRAGASWAGVSDLRLLALEVRRAGLDAEVLAELVGDRRGDKDKLIAASPAKNAKRVRVPVLLGHGDEDRVVGVNHTKAMARELERADKAVSVHIYKDEFHSFSSDRNRIDFFTKLAAFLAQHIGRN